MSGKVAIIRILQQIYNLLANLRWQPGTEALEAATSCLQPVSSKGEAPCQDRERRRRRRLTGLNIPLPVACRKNTLRRSNLMRRVDATPVSIYSAIVSRFMDVFDRLRWDNLSILPRILLPTVLSGSSLAVLVSVVGCYVDLPSWFASSAIIVGMTATVWVGLHRRVRQPLLVAQAWLNRPIEGEEPSPLQINSADEPGRLAASINELLAIAFRTRHIFTASCTQQPTVLSPSTSWAWWN